MKDTIAMILFPLTSLILGSLGSVITAKNIPWIKGLKKPSLYPPKWIIGPVWTILYIIIGVSGYLIWREDNDAFNGKYSCAWKIFGAQLILNYLWTPIFFGLHKLLLAFFEIIILDACILFNIWAFYQINPTAAYLLIPYFIWVSFASYLNYAIWSLNSESSTDKKAH